MLFSQWGQCGWKRSCDMNRMPASRWHLEAKKSAEQWLLNMCQSKGSLYKHERMTWWRKRGCLCYTEMCPVCTKIVLLSYTFSVLATYKHKGNGKVWCLTVSCDFIRRVEPPVATRWRADVHVEIDIFSQPVTALLVPHKYWLLPVFSPFTVVKRKRKGTEKTRNKGEWWERQDHSSQLRIEEEETERDGHCLSLWL